MVVAMGYYPGDQELAKKLAAWIRELGPNKGHTMLLARDVRCANDGSIKANLEAVFDKVEIINIPEKIDGWKFAPNIVIRYIAVHVEQTNPQPWLFIEPDVVPLREGWVDTLAREYDEHKKPFLGDFVKVENVIPHMSGIAVYPGKVTDHAPDIKFAAQSETPWDCFAADQIVPKMAQSRHIAHRWLHPAFNNQSEVDNLLGQLGADCVLFHSDHSGTLIDFLRERRHSKPQQSPVQVNVEAGKGILCDIFIKTYSKDFQWVEWCLKSIQRFATGFRKTVVVLPESSFPYHFPNMEVQTRYPHGMGNANPDSYLDQQIFKLYADTCTDADWILFTDSDTIFTRPVTPETYLKNGKFVWMMTPMQEAHPDEQQAWRRVMRKFFGREPEYEFMRRHPFLLPRWLLADLREFCVRQHGVELKDYVMAQPYREFTEFNILGMFAYEYHRDKFEWLDTSKVPEAEWPILTVDQQWSHNPIPTEKWEKILQSGSMVKTKSVDPDLARLSTNETNLNSGLQTTLKEKRQQQAAKMRAAKAAKRKLPWKEPFPQNMGTEISQLVKNGNLDYHLSEVAKHFVSPLAKGRIFKRLKAFPVLK